MARTGEVEAAGLDVRSSRHDHRNGRRQVEVGHAARCGRSATTTGSRQRWCGSSGPCSSRRVAISAGQRVLDVAAGTGNVAIRAAETGAEVVASDITPENLEAGRREAAAHEASSSSGWRPTRRRLPFGDGEFDVVTSSLGAIFAPDHQRVADELLRVCRPGGHDRHAQLHPRGTGGATSSACSCPTCRHRHPSALPPVLWGSEEHVRELFGDGVEHLELTRGEYVERAASPTRLLRLLQGDVRACRCRLRSSRT